MSELTDRIEVHLLTAQRWVSAEELCRQFDVRERALRARRKIPGLCSDFAISGDRGYKHFRCATDEEFESFAEREEAHSWGQLRRIRQLRVARTSAVTGRPPIEKFTGQRLLI